MSSLTNAVVKNNLDIIDTHVSAIIENKSLTDTEIFTYFLQDLEKIIKPNSDPVFDFHDVESYVIADRCLNTVDTMMEVHQDSPEYQRVQEIRDLSVDILPLSVSALGWSEDLLGEPAIIVGSPSDAIFSVIDGCGENGRISYKDEEDETLEIDSSKVYPLRENGDKYLF